MSKLLIKSSVISVLAATFLSACSSGIAETVVATSENIATTPAEVTRAIPHPTENGAWTTYRSAQAGYRVEYPTAWLVNEQIGSDGSIVTTFSAPDGSAGVMVLVQSGEFGSSGSSDLPNTRCEEVESGELTGTRCLDTLSSSISTTFVSQGKTYIITSTSKRLDATIYDRFLASFRLT